MEDEGVFPPKKLAKLGSIMEPVRASSSTRILESRRRRKLTNPEVVDGFSKNCKQCHCKLTRCLKLYCKCFASGVYCNGCDCEDCHNNVENEDARQLAMEICLKRKLNAFRPKISSSQGALSDMDKAAATSVVSEQWIRCQCKKTECRNGYCDCFHANVSCRGCKCSDCKNSQGFKKVRQKKASPDHSGISSVPPDQVVQSPQSSRCLLADTLQPEDIRKICSLLVAASESIKLHAGENDIMLMLREGENRVKSSLQSIETSHEAIILVPTESSNFEENQADKIDFHNSKLGGHNLLELKPASPETIALICHEKIHSFSEFGSHDQPVHQLCKSEVYLAQERLVLSALRDYLIKLISYGDGELKKFFASARGQTTDV